METKRIPKDQLQQYFDAFSKRYVSDDSPQAADVELISNSLGDQIIVDGARLAGITYDPHDDALDFAIELTVDRQADHRIVKPSEVWVIEEDDGFVSSLEVVRADGMREVATIRKVGLRRTDDSDDTRPG
jgi:hypothetical protein